MTRLTRLAAMCAIAGLLGSLAACAGTAAGSSSTSSSGGMVAEVDVYSGRPNPSWHLDSDAAAAVASCVAHAEAGAAPSAAPDGLGFRGIVVRGVTIDGDRDGSLRSLPDRLTLAAHGKNYTASTCTTAVFAALRASAAAHLTAQELDLIPKGQQP